MRSLRHRIGPIVIGGNSVGGEVEHGDRVPDGGQCAGHRESDRVGLVNWIFEVVRVMSASCGLESGHGTGVRIFRLPMSPDGVNEDSGPAWQRPADAGCHERTRGDVGFVSS